MRNLSLKASGPLVLALTVLPVQAGEFENAARVGDAELAEMRGGFVLAEGVSVGFGAVVRTSIDGALALETELSWQQEGAVIAQRTGEGLTPEGALVKTVTLGGQQALVLGQGETAIVHRVTGGSIQNIVLNTASGRDIRQETEVTLTLTGFAPLQAEIAAVQWGRALAGDLALASTRATAR